ncbi:MAG: RIP metalloprotease RseP [Thiohalomonadaceae bacterium]
MFDFLTSALAFVLALSVLIAVHEFGHFWVARRLGVKVLRFSIGFGRPVWSTRRGPDQTEYVLAAVPLGGYVKMLDEREGEVPAGERHRAFNRQTVGRRFAIVAAGPAFNLLFAVLAYWLMFVAGVPGLKSLVGDVDPDSLAARAGIRAGMEIVAVDGEPTPTWGAVLEAVMPHALRQQPVPVTAREEGQDRVITLGLDEVPHDVSPEALPSIIGLTPYRPPLEPVIGEVVPGSAADRAGLAAGDRIVAIDGSGITEWEELVLAVRNSPGRPLAMHVVRDGAEHDVQIRPERFETEDGPVGRIGAGVYVDPTAMEELRAVQQYGLVAAVGAAAERTWEMSTLTLRMMGEMVVGRASVENISGPITIARYAGVTASAGLAQFLGFLAVVSVSLGVLNLLPIPVLDGGHLAFYAVEAVRRRPASERAEVLAQKVGLTVILMLMLVAFYNDLVRLAG